VSAAPKSDRNVIPRWRGYDETVLLGELGPARRARPPAWAERRGGLQARSEEWARHRSLSFAGDLVGSAMLLGASPEALEAAEQILGEERASPLAREAARRLQELAAAEPERQHLEPEAPSAEQIGRIRRSTRINQRNAIRWSELSRFYTIAGKRKKALRAMIVARSLAPTDRYVLRCAARLEIHHGRVEHAAAMLRGPASASGDPWLLSAGLAAAFAAEEPSGLVRRGQKLLESGSFSAFETSELASALGTLEVREGDDRAARRLFRQALEDPTDNAVAQAEWASSQSGGIVVPDQYLNQVESWEARAWAAARNGEREKAVKEAWSWHRDQPFASRPGEFGSYHASIDEDFENGAKIAKAALRANPDEFLLINNAAFCLASLDRTDEANAYLSEVRRSEISARQRCTFLATRGLIAFREGRLEEGRALYRQSIDSWTESRGKRVAEIMLAREELRAHTPNAEELEAQVRRALDGVTDEDLLAWLKQLDGPIRVVRIPLKGPTRSRGG
jgi:tetratricopeptide (TPR) repeat protein